MRAAALVVFAVLSGGCGKSDKSDARPPIDREDIAENEARIAADLRELQTAVGEFYLEYNDFPNALSQLAAPNAFGKILVRPERLTDPWGEPYRYDPAGGKMAARANREYPDIWCQRGGWLIGNFTAFKVGHE